MYAFFLYMGLFILSAYMTNFPICRALQMYDTMSLITCESNCLYKTKRKDRSSL